MDGLRGWTFSCNFRTLLNFGEASLRLIAVMLMASFIQIQITDFIHVTSCQSLSSSGLLPSGVTSLNRSVKDTKGSTPSSANAVGKFSIVVGAVRPMGSVLCCVAHYAAVMTRNSSESHTCKESDSN